MKIELSPTTAGHYGGALKGNLRHLNRFIQNELDNSSFKTSFDEINIMLAYPPMYVLPGVVGIEKDFMKDYDSLPHVSINRRFKKIHITLKAPEFSEHFHKEEQKEYEHKFEIEPHYKNISEADLGKIVIDKFIKAGEIITAEISKKDFFEFTVYKDILNSIKQNIDGDFLKSINSILEQEISYETIKKATEIRNKRNLQAKPKDKLIRDLRVYYDHDFPKNPLYPYDYQYSEIFLNLLEKERLMCPTYHHLYIQVATSMDEALKKSFAYEDWYVKGLATIDYENYKTLSEKGKEEIVFQLIITGLKDIATIDKLDISIIDRVISKIEEKGLDTELHFKTIENNRYHLTITYFSRNMKEECPIYFNLIDKTTNQVKRVQIGKAKNSQLPMWLQKVTLTNKQIKVKSSESMRAKYWLKDKPTTLVFDIVKLMV